MLIHPTLNKAKVLARKYNAIILQHSFLCDWLEPVSLYHKLKSKFKGESFLLESVEGEERVCRYSFLGFMPREVIKIQGEKVYLNRKKFKSHNKPLYELKKVLKKYQVYSPHKFRFSGGLVGYLGYDAIRHYEPVGEELPPSLGCDDAYFILPKLLIVFDHTKREVEVLYLYCFDKFKAGAYLKEIDDFKKIIFKIKSPHSLSPLNFNFSSAKDSFISNFTKKEFEKNVQKAKTYIRQGNIIQVVLSQRLKVSFSGDPFYVYRILRLLNPSPYMFYLNFKEVKIAGSSPEMLIRCENGNLITRPIAGTRKRGKDDLEDEALRKELLSDEKERAEHIMLVDLARNDLGRVSEKGTVKVSSFMRVEKFSHLMHIVSEVKSKLKKGKDIFSALEACFPAGTVVGAPKVRAMQIINELEKDKREIYAGCVGYFSFTNCLDTGIIIRTIVFKNKYAYIQAGAGIVNDSHPEREYLETLNKAKAQLLAVRLAEGKL